MSNKRQAPDDFEADPQRPDVRNHKRQRRPNDTNPTGGKKYKKAYPVNELKTRIRGLRRLLAHDNDKLPSGVRVQKERALKSAQYELDQANRAQRRTEMITRWHKVRFFDRQKATRRLKKAKKALKEFEEEGGGKAKQKAKLQKKVEDAEVDVNYAINCPLDQPYVSLFPTRKKGEKDQEDAEDEGGEVERQGDPEMWALVKKCMAEGNLSALREGQLRRGGDEDEQTPAAPVENGKKDKQVLPKTKPDGTSKKKKISQEDEANGGASNDEDEDGGNFFE